MDRDNTKVYSLIFKIYSIYTFHDLKKSPTYV